MQNYCPLAQIEAFFLRKQNHIVILNLVQNQTKQAENANLNTNRKQNDRQTDMTTDGPTRAQRQIIEVILVKLTFGDGTTEYVFIILSGYSSLILDIINVPIPDPVPPPREWQSWNP